MHCCSYTFTALQFQIIQYILKYSLWKYLNPRMKISKIPRSHFFSQHGFRFSCLVHAQQRFETFSGIGQNQLVLHLISNGAPQSFGAAALSVPVIPFFTPVTSKPLNVNIVWTHSPHISNKSFLKGFIINWRQFCLFRAVWPDHVWSPLSPVTRLPSPLVLARS